MDRRLCVIGAHSADFVWRAAGSIALVTSQSAVKVKTQFRPDTEP